MNILPLGLLLSLIAWSLIQDRSFIMLYVAIITALSAYCLHRRRKSSHSLKSKLKTAIWDQSGDPSVFGRNEVDLTKVDALLKNHNTTYSDNPVGYSAVFAKALGQGLGISNKIHGKISFGQYIPESEISLTLLLAVESSRPPHFTIRGCNHLTIRELNDIIKRETLNFSQNKESISVKKYENLIKNLPTLCLQIGLRIVTWLLYDVGIDLPIIGLKKNHFGFGMLVDASTANIHDMFLPELPLMKTVTIAVMNTPKVRPIVVNGKIELRNTMRLNITYDHRFGDGTDAMKMLDAVSKVFDAPEKYF